MSLDILCPYCRHEFPVREGRNDPDWFELVDTIHALPAEVHKPLWQYIELYRGKNRLRSSTMLKIVQHLSPMIKRATVMRGSIAYAVSPRQFARAMNYLVEQTPPTLSLPIKSNGYLLEMLASQTEKAAAKTEQQQESNKQQVAQQRKGSTQAISPQKVLDELKKKQALIEQRKQLKQTEKEQQ